MTDEGRGHLEGSDLEGRAGARPEHGQRGTEGVETRDVLDLVAPVDERRPIRIAEMPHQARQRRQGEGRARNLRVGTYVSKLCHPNPGKLGERRQRLDIPGRQFATLQLRDPGNQ